MFLHLHTILPVIHRARHRSGPRLINRLQHLAGVGPPGGLLSRCCSGLTPLNHKISHRVCKDFLSRLNYHAPHAVITQSLIYSGENCGEIVTEIAQTRNSVFTLTKTYWVSLKVTPTEFMGFAAILLKGCKLHARLPRCGVSCLLIRVAAGENDLHTCTYML